MPMFALNVKRLTLLLIAALAAVSGWRLGYAAVLPQAAVAAAVAVVLDAVVALVRTKKLVWSDSGAITGLIVAGVAAPSSPLLMVALATLIAIASKHLLAAKRRNVFNPAAVGLLVGTLLLGLRLSWWVDANHLLTIVAGSVLLAKFAGRWRLVLSFLGLFAAAIAARSLFMGHAVIPDLYLNISIASFFVFFMATDPRTSPVMVRDLPLYAAVMAAGAFVSVVYHPMSLFLGGLLLANLVALGLNHRALRPRAPAPKPAPQVPVVPAAPSAVPPVAN